MQSERASLKEKKFSSLLRSRKGPNISGGVRPINTLTTPKRTQPENEQMEPGVEQPPTIHKSSGSNTSPKNTLDIKFQRNKEIRGRLSGLNHHQITQTRSPMITPSYSLQVNDCCDLPINIRLNNLLEPPLVAIQLKSFQFNGRKFKYNGKNNFALQVSSNNKFLFITKDGSVVNNFVIHRESQLKSLVFSDDSILIELNQDRGLIIATHYGRDGPFRQYFNEHSEWNIDATKTVKSVELILSRVRQAEQSVTPPESKQSIFDSLKNMKKTTPTRITRSNTRHQMGGDEESSPISIDTIYGPFSDGIFQDDDFRQHETPAPFSPDLNFNFPDNKLFTITATDFKTLYNNEWINDTVIDFFIQYEIDQALKNNPLLNSNDIYAFNSFFFTKLTQKKNSPSECPDFYDNIKRWLVKIQLMEYSYIIMPINEHAHWYGCIIRGLPDLLKVAKEEREMEMEVSNNPIELDSQKSNDDEPNSDSDMPASDMTTSDADEHKNKKFPCEIFVFDSLSHKHSNIKLPLKRFIIDYCKDVYNVNIRKNQIRVINARVPKQNNFNDCGIHVIYNIRKWINNIVECEKIWRSSNSNNQIILSKSLFSSSERNGMRKQLINILLDLHAKQEQRVDVHKPNDEEDDVIFIEHRSNDKDKIQYPKTLDPRAESEQKSDRFINSELNLRYGTRDIPELAITTLNELIPEQTAALAIMITENVELFLDTLVKTDKEDEIKLVQQFRESFRQYEASQLQKPSIQEEAEISKSADRVSKLSIESDTSMELSNTSKSSQQATVSTMESKEQNNNQVTSINSSDSDDNVLLVDDTFSSPEKLKFEPSSNGKDSRSRATRFIDDSIKALKRPNEVIEQANNRDIQPMATSNVNNIKKAKCDVNNIDSKPMSKAFDVKRSNNQHTFQGADHNSCVFDQLLAKTEIPRNNKEPIKGNIYESKSLHNPLNNIETAVYKGKSITGIIPKQQKPVETENQHKVTEPDQELRTMSVPMSKSVSNTPLQKLPRPLREVQPLPSSEPTVLKLIRHSKKPAYSSSIYEPLALSPRSNGGSNARTPKNTPANQDEVIELDNEANEAINDDSDVELSSIERTNSIKPGWNGKVEHKSIEQERSPSTSSQTSSQEDAIEVDQVESSSNYTNEIERIKYNASDKMTKGSNEKAETDKEAEFNIISSLIEIDSNPELDSEEESNITIIEDEPNANDINGSRAINIDSVENVKHGKLRSNYVNEEPKKAAPKKSNKGPKPCESVEESQPEKMKEETQKALNNRTVQSRTRSKGTKLVMLGTRSNLIEVSSNEPDTLELPKSADSNDISITKQVFYLDSEEKDTKDKSQRSKPKRRKLN
ncbi:Ubiquitin-like-specific protease 2 [Spathaspora sp. JA1]|nr:Ubiquitin-like-specific protease 2 [Spathaspora sp. JA1]